MCIQLYFAAKFCHWVLSPSATLSFSIGKKTFCYYPPLPFKVFTKPLYPGHIHSRPQRPRSFWSALRIATSGLLQRHSGFEWLCKHNTLRPEPILDSEDAQSDGKSVNHGLTLAVGPGQRSQFLVLTKRNTGTGDENVATILV